jgi:hypothetical protein
MQQFKIRFDHQIDTEEGLRIERGRKEASMIQIEIYLNQKLRRRIQYFNDRIE